MMTNWMILPLIARMYVIELVCWLGGTLVCEDTVVNSVFDPNEKTTEEWIIMTILANQ